MKNFWMIGANYPKNPGKSVEWVKKDINFPEITPEMMNSHMKRELVIEHLVIPEKILKQGPYCVRVDVRRQGKTYARGWSIEAAGFMKSKLV